MMVGQVMKALSIRQPWAWLIVNGYKDIENRNWPTYFRGRIYIHASKRFDEKASSWLAERRLAPVGADMLKSLPYGGIVGEVDIIDCVACSPSPWFVGKYGFVLANPETYDKAIPCKGRLGFFKPKIGHI
jgi:hypothetical protein